jgi:hypothetical protein
MVPQTSYESRITEIHRNPVLSMASQLPEFHESPYREGSKLFLTPPNFTYISAQLLLVPIPKFSAVTPTYPFPSVLWQLELDVSSDHLSTFHVTFHQKFEANQALLTMMML